MGAGKIAHSRGARANKNKALNLIPGKLWPQNIKGEAS